MAYLNWWVRLGMFSCHSWYCQNIIIFWQGKYKKYPLIFLLFGWDILQWRTFYIRWQEFRARRFQLEQIQKSWSRWWALPLRQYGKNLQPLGMVDGWIRFVRIPNTFLKCQFPTKENTAFYFFSQKHPVFKNCLVWPNPIRQNPMRKRLHF